MIYTFMYLCIWIEQLFPRHIRKRKKRYAYLEVGNVGNSRLFRGKSVMVSHAIAWAAITIL